MLITNFKVTCQIKGFKFTIGTGQTHLFHIFTLPIPIYLFMIVIKYKIINNKKSLQKVISSSLNKKVSTLLIYYSRL